MNNSNSEPLLRSPSTDKQPIYNYIDAHQLYIQHCSRTSSHLAYPLVILPTLSFSTSHAPPSAKSHCIWAALRWAWSRYCWIMWDTRCGFIWWRSIAPVILRLIHTQFIINSHKNCSSLKSIGIPSNSVSACFSSPASSPSTSSSPAPNSCSFLISYLSVSQAEQFSRPCWRKNRSIESWRKCRTDSCTLYNPTLWRRWRSLSRWAKSKTWVWSETPPSITWCLSSCTASTSPRSRPGCNLK